ncbi:hypothetical protein [Streptomyces sp. NPDC058622]
MFTTSSAPGIGLAGFRRLLEEKAQWARERSDVADGWLPRLL